MFHPRSGTSELSFGRRTRPILRGVVDPKNLEWPGNPLVGAEAYLIYFQDAFYFAEGFEDGGAGFGVDLDYG